jgi:hypothetical protein
MDRDLILGGNLAIVLKKYEEEKAKVSTMLVGSIH